jgi:hypothetical protein
MKKKVLLLSVCLLVALLTTNLFAAGQVEKGSEVKMLKISTRNYSSIKRACKICSTC